MYVTDAPVREAEEAPPFTLRPVRPGDGDAIAHILFDAFAAIHDRHAFPRDFPTLDAAAQLTSAFIGHPRIWGVVAERDGRVVGSNFLDERGPIRGVGPITVDPREQTRGVGRGLMQAVIDRGAGAAGIRLLQDAFNVQTLGLYASLGFEVREPVVVMGGRPAVDLEPGLDVRPLAPGDVGACAALHEAVHGFDRTAELADALHTPALQPWVAVRDGRIVAYATGATFFAAAHGAAETEEDLFAVIAGALRATDAPASFLLPTRQGTLFRACLDAGLRVVKPMNLMSLRAYRTPAGAWFPSVLY